MQEPCNDAGEVLALRTDDMTWRELDGEIVVLDLDASVYLNVTGAGSVAWKLLAEGTTLESLVTAVLEVFDVDAAVARADLATFLDDLRERKLLR